MSKSQLLTITFNRYIDLNHQYLFYYSVVKYPLIVCPSTLKSAEKEILRNLMAKIGGEVSRDWSENCSHLCMNSVTVTEKVNYTCL